MSVSHAATDREDVDVVVVGARCAGAGTALLLARAGLSVLLVDRGARGADTTSTHALTRTAVLQLSRWGVLDEVRASGAPRVSQVVYHYGDDAVTIPIRAVGDVDGLYAPRRSVLDRLLVDEAVRSGAQVRHHTALRELHSDADGHVGGVTLDERGRTRHVGCRLVIGADGAASTVARLVCAPVERRAADCSATVYGYVEGLSRHAYHNYFRHHSIAGVIPTNDGRANVWIGVDRERFRREAHGDPAGFFARTLASIDPALAEHVRRRSDGSPLRTFAGRRGFVRRASGPGWALVGDACYFKDPTSAHGMTDAFVGAELLSRSVVRALRDGDDQRNALADYSARRAALTDPMMPAIAHVVSFDWGMRSLQQAHHDISRVMRTEWDAVSELAPAPLAAEAVSATC